MPAFLPVRRRCGTMQVHHRLRERDPDFRIRQAELERKVHNRLAAGTSVRQAVTTVPVVVHVVYKTADEKITAAQVKSQIAALNKDYRATNPDKSKVPSVWQGLGTDARRQFALANPGPAGQKASRILYERTTPAPLP